ncbi:hypothetical protein CALCODRAFT_555905 [Calocera cornea HHB12733]|uniref:Uncharacterized protein n=1 Tax=Calocera cornea HHB12733 TaxID=1353952 RepID=A0A165FAK1_9BASI|nr:hypothetical protein CALCODRAFT_555905 [Calocera cornea HHB12733]
MNRGEEGGMVDAAFQILRYKAWNFDDVAVRTMPLTSYETVNKALARFIERGEDRAYTYLGLSAKQEGDRLWKDGTLTEEKKEHLSRMAIENLQLAAVRRYSLAMTTLGSLFFDGKLVPRDAFLAKLWWEEGFKYARAAQWFHLRPGMLEVDHIHFWGNSPDPQKAAMYYAWSGRQRISEGKLGWAELLLYDLADLNSGIELLERYRQDIAAGGKELVSDTNEDVDGQRRGFEDVAEGLSPKPDREIWPFSFDQEGKEIWEREIRSSTRLEKIDAALRLMYSRFIPRKHRMERTGLCVDRWRAC